MISDKPVLPSPWAMSVAGTVRRCADCGFDLAGGRVEVVPAAQFFMGGVVDYSGTRTALEGPYVTGEASGGANGFNRLDGDGVKNSIVVDVAGEVIAADLGRLVLGPSWMRLPSNSPMTI